MLKSVTAVLFLLVVIVHSSPLQSMSSINDPPAIMALEEECVRQGGICQRAENCDPENMANQQLILCPKQVHLGVVCCYL